MVITSRTSLTHTKLNKKEISSQNQSSAKNRF
jgi:hypothetical protein